MRKKISSNIETFNIPIIEDFVNFLKEENEDNAFKKWLDAKTKWDDRILVEILENLGEEFFISEIAPTTKVYTKNTRWNKWDILECKWLTHLQYNAVCKTLKIAQNISDVKEVKRFYYYKK